MSLEDVYRRFLPGRTPPGFQVNHDPRTIGSHLRIIAGDLLDSVVERVGLELPIARSSLLSVLSRRERLVQERMVNLNQFDPSLEAKWFGMTTGVLHGVLSFAGGMSSDVIRNFNSKGVARFLSWLKPIADEIVTIAASATSLRRAELEAFFDGSRFTFTKTSRHTAAVESNIISTPLWKYWAVPQL